MRDFACQDVLVGISGDGEAGLAAKFAVMRPFLDERAWRVYLGTEANALGYGGIAAVARASGASETTVAAGAEQARDPAALAALVPGRSRRPGAGRPRAEEQQPGLAEELGRLLEEGRRGDPVSAVTWNILSLRDIARQMTLRGFPCGKDVIARLMHEAGYSLQGMAKVLEGRQHEDRDIQFGNILAALLAEISLPWQAERERRLTLARGRARIKDSGGGPARLPFEAAVAAAACRLRLGMSYTLLGQLFGVWHTTIRDAVLPLIPLLEARGITPRAGAPRIKTLAQLQELAAAQDITMNVTPP